MSEQEIKQTILKILKPLQDSGRHSWIVIAIGFLASTSLGILMYKILELAPSPYLIVFVLSFVFIGLGVGMKISTSAQTRAVKSYREAFPENSTKRGVADHLLASLDSPKETVESLCRGLGVLGGEKARRAELAEAEQLRQQTEIESSRTDLDQTQKNWPITTQFECGSCNRNIDWMQGARNHVCHYCKVTLMLPPHMTCPFCGGVNIQIMSKPQYKFTFAGALIYGPAGLLVGTLIDSALDGSKQVIREKIKNPVFCCESCKKYWGIKMPVAIREGGRMIPSSEKGNNIMVELEKLGELKKQGLLTEEEFLAAKSKIIG